MMKRYLVFTILIFLTTMFFSTATVFAQQLQQVPDVAGMDSVQARQTLEKAGFKCAISGVIRTTDQNMNGKIASQTPAGGQKAIRGSEVSLSPYQYRQPPDRSKI